MASVDDRVVQMQFDNASFERKIAQTMKSIDQLQKSLDVANTKKGFDELGKLGKTFNLSNMTSAIEGVSKSFIALSTIGITVLSNLTNRAVDAGIRMVKALSFDQIIAGFQEYELNMKSIQTILANTKADGTNLQQVNAALDELNSYADQTIYNFAEMARNIGTFTAAGVDLDTSVASIKGIANAAAISGSTSQQASTAMYQLSQAIASGSLKLMDWNSVVNAGMGGEVMQRALFQTGKAMGTLTGVDLETSFDDWKDAGNSFRESLQEGWITTDVLTTTLRAFSGELGNLTDEEIRAMGFTDDMIAEIRELGETGIEAATKVRTLTQLFDTLGEAIGSGWSQSFRIVLGDFEEATELFTGISGALDEMVSSSADARNELLQGWKDLGGRTTLIAALHEAFVALGEIFAPIKEAFREIFPPLTSERLMEMTNAFRVLAVRMRPSGETVDNLKRIFTGFFGALEIGWTIIKEGARFIGELFSEFSGAGSGNFLEFAAKIGDFFTDLNTRLVDGGGIVSFFDQLGEVVRDPLPYLEDLKDRIIEFFKGLELNVEIPNLMVKGFDRLEQRFETLGKIADGVKTVWDKVAGVFRSIYDVLEEVWQHIRGWFSELGSKMADAAEPGDFDAVVDVVNVGLLGGIGAILAKFLKDGIPFDFGHGFFAQATEALEEVTGVLKAMQADIKANALLKIAGALGILTLSVVALALVDSEDLAKALSAMAVGFGQLLTVFGIINKLAVGPQSAASFTVLATGMTILSGAMVLMALAAKMMAGLNWEELGRGLTGVAALMTMMVAASYPLSANAGGMIRAGTGMIFLGVALNILALAVRQFASMSWEEMAQGLLGVAGALTAIVLAMKFMPDNIYYTGLEILFIAVAMNLLALAVRQFASMSWEEMGQGLAGVAGGLVAIGLGMRAMPSNMPLTAGALILVAGALFIIGEAMKTMASFSWEELGRGLAGIAGSLLLLAIAAHAMSGAVLGALAITVMAGGLYLLGDALNKFANLSVGEIIKGLIALSATMATIGILGSVLGLAAPLLLAFGAALLVVGAGFILFGAGAYLMAKALSIVAATGRKAIPVFMELIDQLIRRIPDLLKAVGEGLLELANVFLEAAPVFIEQLGVIFGHILETIIELSPQLFETIGVLLSDLLQLIRDKFPEIVETGFDLLMALLSGIADNIGEVVSVAGDIVIGFVEAILKKLGELATTVIRGFVDFIHTVSYELGRAIPNLMIGTGAAFVQGLRDGIDDQMPNLKALWNALPTDVIAWIGDTIGTLFSKGWDLIEGLWNGIWDRVGDVISWFTNLPSAIFGWIGSVIGTLTSKGTDLIAGLWDGIWDRVQDVISWFKGLPRTVFGWIGNTFQTLFSKGYGFISGLWSGVWDRVQSVIEWFEGLGDTVVGWIGDALGYLYDTGWNLIQGLWDGVEDRWNDFTSWIVDAAKEIVEKLKKPWELFSPSRVMRRMGEDLIMGLAIGVEKTTPTVLGNIDNLNDDATYKMDQALRAITNQVMEMDEFHPTITPVLDLSQVRSGARELDTLIPSYSYAQANEIASTEVLTDELTGAGTAGITEVKFEQNNYSPTQLSTADIYRQSRNLVTLAKEELSIP